MLLDKTVMERKVCKNLPEHLVERIIAMLPFPTILRARCLSRGWDARFMSTDQQWGEAKKRAALFQNLMAESCRKWKTFCPVLIGTKGDLVAYDKEAHIWQQLPSVSFLPVHVLSSSSIQIEGTLLYASDTPSQQHDGVFYVANILTRAWKELPPPPMTYGVIHSSKLVIIDKHPQSYKLILMGQRTVYIDDFHLVTVYDSTSQSWSEKKTIEGQNEFNYEFRLNSVHLNGVVYTGSSYSPPDVCAYHIENWTFQKLHLAVYDRHGQVDLSGALRWQEYKDECNHYHLVVCRDRLFMVAGTVHEYEKVLEIDVGALKLLELSHVARPNPCVLTGSPVMAPIADESLIYFGFRDDCCRQYICTYNVDEGLWSCSMAVPRVEYQYNWVAAMKPSMAPFLVPYVAE